MRLSAIKLAGFKSFVEPTVLTIPSDLVAVIGPNGSGKSNVIDAVRWVLGESSLKSLRGSDSEDVIFNGSKTRKPAGRASVELVFDNSDGRLAGAYASYAEISIRRELVREESAQYYLNGRKCLKRDVVDLFLGTGLGGRNQYAILEQGTISRLVEAKPEELRMWLEEAAGVSRYRDRRRETETRMRQTRENLERLNDVQGELQHRVDVLVRQSSDAEKFRKLKAEEELLRVELLLLRRRALEARAEAQTVQIQVAEQALDAQRQRLVESNTARDRADVLLREVSQKLNDRQGEIYLAQAEVARCEQALAHAQEVQNLRARELKQLEAQMQEAASRRQRDELRLDELLHAAEDAQGQVARWSSEEQSLRDVAGAAEETLGQAQLRWEEFSQQAQAPLLQAEGERVRLQGFAASLSETEERLARLERELHSLDPEPVQSGLFALEGQVQQLEETLVQGDTVLQSLDRDVQQLREQRARGETALHEARQTLEDARGRKASLETLQQAALRQDDAELSDWLKAREWVDLPRLASVLSVSPGWEAAAEHVLGGLLQAPLVGSWSSLTAPPQGPAGGAAVVAAQPGELDAETRTLAGLVQGPAVVREWLTGIRVAASPEAAAKLVTELEPGESVIAADGVWRGRGWVRYPRRDSDHSGVIQRGLLLRQLEGQVAAQGQAVRERESELAEVIRRLHTAENERRALSSRREQARNEHARHLAEQQAQRVRLEQIGQRHQRLLSEIEQLRNAREQQARDLEEGRLRLTDLERTAERLRAERTGLNQQLAEARQRAQDARQAWQIAAQSLGQQQVRAGALVNQHATLRDGLVELEERERSLRERHEIQLAEQTASGGPTLADISAPLEEARAKLAALRDLMLEVRANLTAAEGERDRRILEQREAEATRESAMEAVQRARLEYENLRAHRESLMEQLAEHAGADLVNPPEDPGATVEGWEQKLVQCLRRTERLGPINLAAIDELEEARGRAQGLTDQRRDLEQALATLEDAIRKLDHETDELLRTTFQRLDAKFRDRCPKLFGGGEAYLELTSEDMLETGVRVMARPPGKRNSSIQLLSGGEKAMTAIALLFSLFDLNPAPFCLLDEVDAPLDDANVGRFCDVVRDMSANVQFIMITHNKITMEMAEQLHGVTMQEPGVSRLVSVDIQQALQLAQQPGEPAEA